ncbi:MAG: twitching motility protein PilT [Streptomycetales bacterium]
MSGLIYDAGALLAAERRDTRLWALHDEAMGAGILPVVPVVVLAQAWRGGPQAELSRLLRGCRILPDTEPIGRAAGRACAAAGAVDVVDAIVVVSAAASAAVVVTSDVPDLARLAEAVGVRLRLHQV